MAMKNTPNGTNYKGDFQGKFRTFTSGNIPGFLIKNI